MPLWLGLILTLLLLAAFRFVGPALMTGPALAALILLVARASGRSWAEIGLTTRGGGWALAAVVLTALVYGAALAIPFTRRLFRDARPRSNPFFTALIAVPLATVAIEEAAFRGALWPLGWVTPLLFGLWHVVPGARPNGVVVTFAFTTAAGILFALLRHFSGGLLAPFVLHWAVNGFGVLALQWSRD